MSQDDVTTLIAVRHGETAWNRATRIQGHLDIPLNATGRAQAQRVAQALAGETVHAVYASDLRRAAQTADAIAAGLNLPVQYDIGLRERAFGVFEGLTWAEIERDWPAECLRWRQRDPDFGAPGGEVLKDFYQRCIDTIAGLAQRHPGQTLVIVAHGGVMDCLYRAGSRVSLQTARSWTLGNATINRLIYSPEGFNLIGWNDDFHLEGLSLDETSDGALDDDSKR